MLFQYVHGPLLMFIVYGYVWFRLRHHDAVSRRQVLNTLLPFLVGLALAMMFGVAVFMIFGLLLSIAFALWLNHFQFPAAYRTARKQAQENQLSQALETLNEMIPHHTDLWQAYQLRSTINSLQGYFIHAESDARKAISLKPQASVNYSALGQVFWQQADFEQSWDAFSKAHDLATGSFWHSYNLGINAFRLGSYQKAVSVLKVAQRGSKRKRQISPTTRLLLHYYLGRSAEKSGQATLAHKAFKQMARHAGALSMLREQTAPSQPALRTVFEADLEDIERILERNG